MLVAVPILTICSACAYSAPKPLTIPITPAPDNHIHLSVDVNGGPPLDFIFDTGANICVLTERGRTKLADLRFDGRQETLGSGGVTRRPTASNVTLTIHGRDWTGQTLMLVDYGGSLHADGVIGYNLFSQDTITLDFDRGVLEVFDRMPAAATRLSPVPVTMRDDLAFIPVTLNTGTAISSDLAAVDTGYGGTVTIAAPLAKRAALPGKLERLGTGTMGGTGSGAIEIVTVRLHRLTLANISTDNVPVDVQLRPPHNFKTWDIIGNELLRRFNVVWDIPARRMYFSKNSFFADVYKMPPDRRNGLKIGLTLLATIFLAGVALLRWSRRRNPA